MISTRLGPAWPRARVTGTLGVTFALAQVFSHIVGSEESRGQLRKECKVAPDRF